MSPAARILPTVGWGIFCAASWTWCIGMFLPLIMLRDDGWVGFFVFAIPNVIGCTAFGYVVSRQGARRAMQRSPGMIATFSIATVAYQLFFVGFILTALWPDSVSPAAVGVVVLLIAAAVGGHRLVPHGAPLVDGDRGRVPWPTLMLLGVIVWIFSMIIFAIVGTSGWADFGASGRMEPREIGWFVPLLIFGLLLCPYFDGTFHVARIAAPSRHAFAIFGITFAAMLLLSAAYTSLLLRHGLSWPILLHMLVQLTFTAAVHVRVINDLRPSVRPSSVGRIAAPMRVLLMWSLWLVAPLFGTLIVPASGAAPVAIDGTVTGSLEAIVPGERWYLRWLALYGLLFPALVLLLRWSPVGDPTRRIVPMTIVLAIGLMLCELGFVQGHRWLVPIPIAAALVVAFWPATNRSAALGASANRDGG